MNIQDWFPLEWTGWISQQSRDSQESSPTLQLRSINSSVLSFLYSPTLTSIHDYWKNHRLTTGLCWQSSVSAFQYAIQVGHSFSSKDQASFNFMAVVTICSDFGASRNKVSVSIVSASICMKWWDQMPWSLFFECWILSQLFNSPLSLSSVLLIFCKMATIILFHPPKLPWDSWEAKTLYTVRCCVSFEGRLLASATKAALSPVSPHIKHVFLVWYFDI